MTHQISDQLLRMSDLAKTPFIPEKTVINKSGKKITIAAKQAQRGIVGFSSKHIYHLIDIGHFPKPIKIGRASLWRRSDIESWIEKQFEKITNE